MSFFSILLTLTMLELPALAIALPFFFFVFQKLQFFFLSVFVVIIFHFHTALIRQSVHKSIHFHCFAINTVCRGCRVFVTLFIVVFSFFLNLFLEFRCYLYVTFIYCFFFPSVSVSWNSILCTRWFIVISFYAIIIVINLSTFFFFLDFEASLSPFFDIVFVQLHPAHMCCVSFIDHHVRVHAR